MGLESNPKLSWVSLAQPPGDSWFLRPCGGVVHGGLDAVFTEGCVRSGLVQGSPWDLLCWVGCLLHFRGPPLKGGVWIWPFLHPLPALTSCD